MSQQPKAPDEARKIFIHAETFSLASIVLEKNGVPHTLFPSYVCAAFCLELYLKCLIFIEKHEPPELHDLKSLFLRLNGKSQTAIKNLHAEQLKAHEQERHEYHEFRKRLRLPPDPMRDDFNTILERGRNAFEDLRYLYEQPAPTAWNGNLIINAAILRILELRPDLLADRIIGKIHPDGRVEVQVARHPHHPKQ